MKPGPGPIRVMHVLHRLTLAGMEYGVIKVVNRLDPRVIAPSICSFRESSPEGRAELRADIPVHEMHRGEHLDAGLILALWRLLRRERIEIVHSHNWSTFPYSVAAARLARVPVIIHGVHGRDTQNPDARLLRRTAERMLAGAVHQITTVSAHLRDEIVRDWRVPPERIVYIPNGVDLARFGVPYAAREIRGRLGVGEMDRLVGTVGWMRAVKDPVTLVRAFQILHRSLPDAKLLVAGLDVDDQFRKTMEREVPGWETLRESVRHLGVRRDIPEILSVLDLYVNASVFEGMSNSILEAMASRKPVVATAVGGTPDLVQDGVTGWLVAPRDPEALAERMERTLRDPALAARLGQEGRARVERHHSYESMVAANASLYERWHERRTRKRRPADALKLGAARALRGSGAVALIERVGRPTLTVLGYYRVLPAAGMRGAPGQAMMISKDLFEQQISVLARDYRVLTQEEVLRHCEERRPFPRRAVWLTLDNGYADNFEHAHPILRRYGVPATIFLVPDPIDSGGQLWWDDVAESLRELHGALGVDAPLPSEIYPAPLREALARMSALPEHAAAESDRIVRMLRGYPSNARSAVVRDLAARAAARRTEPRRRTMLTWEECRQMLGAGITFGAHTAAPGPFDDATEEEGAAEVARTVDQVARGVGVRPVAYSYPAGPPAERLRPWVARCGLRLAITSHAPGLNHEDTDPLMLRSLSAAYVAVGGEFSRSVLQLEMSGFRARLARRRA